MHKTSCKVTIFTNLYSLPDVLEVVFQYLLFFSDHGARGVSDLTVLQKQQQHLAWTRVSIYLL